MSLEPRSNTLAEINRVAAASFRRLRKYLEAAGVQPGSGSSAALPRVNSHNSRDPKPLSALMDDFTEAADLAAPLAVTGLTFRWVEIVGEEIAEHVSIAEFRQETGQLFLQADSTAWATQIRMLTPVILSRIEEELGAGIVSDVSVEGPKGPSWRHGNRRVPGRGPRDTYG